MEGKDLLFDSPKQNNDKLVGKMWKYQKEKLAYQKKIMLREKFAKQLGIKNVALPDKSLGK